MFDKLANLLAEEEGIVARPYQDSKGHWTVGIGWNLEAMPMTHKQAFYMCNEHIRYFDFELNSKLDFYPSLVPARKAVLIDMAFQMGIEGLLEFKDTLGLIKNKEYESASKEMLNSNWGRNFAKRATLLSTMMETGLWP